jgi:hypothetical protein
LHLKYTLSLKDLREGQQFNKKCGAINKDFGSFYVNIARVSPRQPNFLIYFQIILKKSLKFRKSAPLPDQTRGNGL